jgi:Na+/H+ antiporter NhaA
VPAADVTTLEAAFTQLQFYAILSFLAVSAAGVSAAQSSAAALTSPLLYGLFILTATSMAQLYGAFARVLERMAGVTNAAANVGVSACTSAGAGGCMLPSM